jgi:hypothetical protein
MSKFSKWKIMVPKQKLQIILIIWHSNAKLEKVPNAMRGGGLQCI